MWKAEEGDPALQDWSSDRWIVGRQNIRFNQRNQIRRTARVLPRGRCCCFLTSFRSDPSSTKASNCLDSSFRSLWGQPPAIFHFLTFSVRFSPFFVGRFNVIFGMFTSSSGPSASLTFVRFGVTVVPFVRASELARVSGSLTSKHLPFQHFLINKFIL